MRKKLLVNDVYTKQLIHTDNVSLFLNTSSSNMYLEPNTN